MKIEINLKIILLGILFFILKQLDIYLIFIIFIMLHEMAHLSVGMLIRATSKSFQNQSTWRFGGILYVSIEKK